MAQRIEQRVGGVRTPREEVRTRLVRQHLGQELPVLVDAVGRLEALSTPRPQDGLREEAPELARSSSSRWCNKLKSYSS